MITFKQFLHERAENMRAYRKVFKTAEAARVGFEVEVFIPRDNEIAQDGSRGKEPARSTSTIRRFDTFAEFEDYFEVSRSATRSIDSDYEDWLEREKEQYIQDRLDDDMTKDDLEVEFESKQNDEYSWTKWFEDEYANAYDFISNYDLTPKYGWASEDGRHSLIYTEPEPELASNWKNDIGSLIADRLQRNYLKGKRVEYGDPGTGNGTDFIVVPDSSIAADEGERAGYGAEIVTPPLETSEAVDCLSRIFDFIDDEGLKTNQSTGLHINISVPNIERLDPVKLVMFMGDEHVLKQFRRVGNAMTRSQMDRVKEIVSRAAQTGQSISRSSDVSKLLDDIAHQILKTGKYRSVNFEKLKDGYLEFRSAGNSNYHRDLSAVELLVGRWMSAMTAACDPEKDKTVYLKRLAKVFANSDDNADADTSVVELFSKKVPGGSGIKTNDKGAFMALLARIGSTFGDKHKPSFAQIKELRELCRSHGVTAENLINFAKENPKKVALNFNADSAEYLEKFVRVFKLS